jgi:uncharacterized protein with HEPN domain
MKPEVLTALENMRMAIGELERYVRYHAGFDPCMAQRGSQVMAERIVIGEGIVHAKGPYPDLAKTHAPRIRGMRNQLAHDYHRIDQAMVHVALTRHIPVRKAEVEALLDHIG